MIARYDVQVVYAPRHSAAALPTIAAKQQRPTAGLTAFTKADILSAVLAPNQLPLMNNLSRNKQLLAANIRDRENGGRTAVAEGGMFTSTRKICFVLCGGRGTAIPRGSGGLAGYRVGNQRSTGPTAEGKRKARLDLMSDNDAKCIAETPKPPWNGMCAKFDVEGAQ